jgi:hypothetical protein
VKQYTLVFCKKIAGRIKQFISRRMNLFQGKSDELKNTIHSLVVVVTDVVVVVKTIGFWFTILHCDRKSNWSCLVKTFVYARKTILLFV